MAVPMLKVSIPQFCSPFYPWCSTLSSMVETSKNRTSLCCVQSGNSVRSEVSICVGTHLIPHPNKVDKGGEDAFFVSDHSGGVIAVADGVSGWAEKNVDPSLFSRELIANVSYLAADEEALNDSYAAPLVCQVHNDPQILIRKAHAATTFIGSATVIVAVLERDGTLKIANVGDCGLKIIREGQVVFSTSPQEHYFDCPYQLSSEAVGQTYLDATVSNVELTEGDIIVVGSDGLFDNVYDNEIILTTSSYKDVVEAAKALANLASIHSSDSSFDSPYSLEAKSKGYDVPLWKKILGMKLTGGKPDDITVIVGRVVRS